MKWNRMWFVWVIGLIWILSASIDGYGDDTNTDQWIHYGTAADGTEFHYNKTRLIEVKPKVIQVLEMEILSQQAKDEMIQIRKKYNHSLDGWDKLTFSAHLKEVSCIDKTSRWIKTIECDDKGNSLDSMEYSDKEIDSITSGSLGESLFMAVCPKEEKNPEDAAPESTSKQMDKGDNPLNEQIPSP
jgi:hypothetical protein